MDKICAWCSRLLSQHDHIQDRLCLEKLSDMIWQQRKRISRPEIQKLIRKYTDGQSGESG